MKKIFVLMFAFIGACVAMSSCHYENGVNNAETACDSDTIVCDTTDCDTCCCECCCDFDDDEMMVEICPD